MQFLVIRFFAIFLVGSGWNIRKCQMRQAVKLLLVFSTFFNFLIVECAFTVDGYWQFAHSGGIPKGSFVSAIRQHDAQLHHICRAKTDDGSIIPGKLDNSRCIYPLFGEQIADRYEVLVYRNGISYYWEYNEDGGYNDNSVNGGWEKDVRLLICRVRLKDNRANMRWVTGKLHPINRKCYIPLYGETSHVTYEVLMARTS